MAAAPITYPAPFYDAVFGSGTGLVMTASGPLGVPTFTSDVIGLLSQDRAISLSFTNVTPSAVVTSEMTLGAFTSSVSGNFSASVPEPASLVLFGIGVTALFAFRCLLKRNAVALRRPIFGGDCGHGATHQPVDLLALSGSSLTVAAQR